MARILSALIFSFGLLAAAAAAPARDGDLFTQGSKWKGKLTQKGQISGAEMPLNLDAVVTVTKREGTSFEAELFEDGGENSAIRLTYLVRGEITQARDGKGYQVEFKSYAYKDARSQTFLNIPYRGTLAGKTLKGTWKYPKNDEGTTIEGGFTLELSR